MTAQKRRRTQPEGAARPRRPRAPKVEGVTYRMLDHWANLELLHPRLENPQRTGGRGNRRIWPEEELRVARDIGRLRRIGLTLKAAHDLARAGTAVVEAALAAVDQGKGGRR